MHSLVTVNRGNGSSSDGGYKYRQGFCQVQALYCKHGKDQAC